MRAGFAVYRTVARSAEQNRALVRNRKLTMPVLDLSADQGTIADIAECIRPFSVDVSG